MAIPVSADETEVDNDDSLIIPITSGSEKDLFVEIFPEEIKDIQVSNLLKLLTNESPSPDVWANAALMYMQQKRKRESLTLLEAACDEGRNARVLAATGIAHLANGSSGAVDVNEAADQKFSQAAGMDTFFPMTWMGRGMLCLNSDRPEQAKFFFETTLTEKGQVLPALLGMAGVFYKLGNYVEAQNKFADAIRRYPEESGAAARVGFAFSCYQQGQVDRAKAAFDRALAIDPENVEAIVGSAILDMAGGTTEQAIKQMSVANLLDHSNAMVQNHLANHYFWKWTNVTGTVSTKNGSDVMITNQSMSFEIGDPIRIGTDFEAKIEDDLGSSYRLNKRWKGNNTTGLKVWKKDYDRVFALAKGAYNSTKVSSIQAESLFFLARVYHMRGEPEALKFYEKSCRLAPKFAPARFGLAQVLIANRRWADAAKELKKLISQSSHATDAFALLGLLEVRAGQIDDGLAHLRKAIDLDPSNPELLTLEALALQQHRANYGRALDQYKKATDLINRRDGAVPYEVYTNCGVLCHETQKYDEALDMYKKALKVLDDTGNLHKADLANNGVDGIRVMQRENDMFHGFVETKTQATVVNPTEFRIEGLTATSALPFSVGDVIRLNDSFESVVSGADVGDGFVTIKTAEAYDPMVENEEGGTSSVIVRVSRENGLLDNDGAITVAFNIARVHESRGSTLAAIELLKAITKRYPAYVSCYLRLACIAADCGSLQECAQWLKIATKTAPGNCEVLALIGNLHLSLRDWKPAQKVFEGLLVQKIPSVEAYSSLSMGNIYFANMHVVQERYSKHLQYATDFYSRILKKDPMNAYAANGIGTVMAERGEIDKAKDVFQRVRELSGDQLGDAELNLGHIFLFQKRHADAVQLYEKYRKRAEGGPAPMTTKSQIEDIVDVLLYIAFAYFDWARHTELKNNAAPADGYYKEAMTHLEHALAKDSKKETILRYNLCMTKLQAANCCLQRFTRNIPRTVQDVEEALSGLEESLGVVEQMLKDKEDKQKKINIKTQMLEDFISVCKDNISHAYSHLEDEKKRATEEAREKEIRRLATEAAQREAKLQEAIRKEEEAKKEEEQDKRAEEKMRKVDELKIGWQHDNNMEKEKTKKKSVPVAPPVEEVGATGAGLFDSDSDSEAGENAVVQPAAVPPNNPTKSDLFGSEGDSDSDEAGGEKDSGKSKATAGQLFGDSSDEEDGVKHVEGTNTNAVDKNALFGSDDESEEELLPAARKRGSSDSGDEGKDGKKQKISA